MVDLPENSAAAVSTPVAPSPADTAVPSAPAVEATPVITTASETAPAQASTEAPVVAPSATEPTAPAIIAPTIIGAEPVKPTEVTPETKPAEGEKPAEVKKEEGSQSAEPAPLPTYESWTLPEGVTVDEAKAGEFNSLLGEFQNTTKAEQAMVQQFGQKLIDRHVAEVTETVSRLHEAYQQAWVKQTEDWKQKFISDPEIGGNRQETTVAAANEFIITHGGSPEQQAEFRALMQQTGIGNHPAMIRMLANAKRSPSYSEGQPLAAKAPMAAPSRTQRMYGKKG